MGFGVLCLTALALTSHIFTRLAKEEPELYASMGWPRLISNNTPSNSLAFQGFIMRRRYNGLSQPTTRALCGLLFWVQVFWVAAMVAIPVWQFNAA